MKIKPSYDVVVVGGGPAGSMAAWEAAKKGASVCILEKDRDIGYPVRCGEAAAEAGLKKFVDVKDSWIAQKIMGAQLVSPSGNLVDVAFSSETGYILNRRIFDGSIFMCNEFYASSMQLIFVPHWRCTSFKITYITTSSAIIRVRSN